MEVGRTTSYNVSNANIEFAKIIQISGASKRAHTHIHGFDHIRAEVNYRNTLQLMRGLGCEIRQHCIYFGLGGGIHRQ